MSAHKDQKFPSLNTKLNFTFHNIADSTQQSTQRMQREETSKDNNQSTSILYHFNSVSQNLTFQGGSDVQSLYNGSEKMNAKYRHNAKVKSPLTTQTRMHFFSPKKLVVKEMKPRVREIEPKQKAFQTIFSPQYKLTDLLRDPAKPLQKKPNTKKMVLKKKSVLKSGYKAISFDMKMIPTKRGIQDLENDMTRPNRIQSNDKIRDLCSYVQNIKKSKYEPQGAAKSRSPILLKNTFSPVMYRMYRAMKNRQKNLKQVTTPEVELTKIPKVAPKMPELDQTEGTKGNITKKNKITPDDPFDDFTKQFMIQSKIGQVKLESESEGTQSKKGSNKILNKNGNRRTRNALSNPPPKSCQEWSVSKAINIMRTKKEVEENIEKKKINLLQLDFYSFFEMVSQGEEKFDFSDPRIIKLFNKYYERARIEIYKDRTKFRTKLMKARVNELKEFRKKHQIIELCYKNRGPLDYNHKSLYNKDRIDFVDIPSNKRIIDEYLDDVDEEELLKEEINAMKKAKRRVRVNKGES
ncbi:unnamed protein product [Moneuplotes crassus]|uniref:Uncharacterized protein n=2 Tax=Euplotes crassus TaxID=5936 RepID=A0AAD1U692_EUPCR|nr:unnamed protein product [Moneuplotes crassus]